MVERLKVYLIWNHSRVVHGEGRALFEVCATRTVAINVIDLECGDDEGYRACFSIEPHAVRE